MTRTRSARRPKARARALRVPTTHWVESYRRRVRQVGAPGRHRDRARGPLLSRRGLPPGLPGQEPGRLHRPPGARPSGAGRGSPEPRGRRPRPGRGRRPGSRPTRRRSRPRVRGGSAGGAARRPQRGTPRTPPTKWALTTRAARAGVTSNARCSPGRAGPYSACTVPMRAKVRRVIRRSRPVRRRESPPGEFSRHARSPRGAPTPTRRPLPPRRSRRRAHRRRRRA